MLVASVCGLVDRYPGEAWGEKQYLTLPVTGSTPVDPARRATSKVCPSLAPPGSLIDPVRNRIDVVRDD